MNLGKKYLLNEQYEDAINAFTSAAAISPKDDEAYLGRGDAYMGLSQKDKAEKDYNTAITLNPDDREYTEKKLGTAGTLEKDQSASTGTDISSGSEADSSQARPDSTTGMTADGTGSIDTATAQNVFNGCTLITENVPSTVDLDSSGDEDTVYYTRTMDSEMQNIQTSITLNVNGVDHVENISTNYRHEDVYLADINIHDGYRNIIINIQDLYFNQKTYIYSYKGNDFKNTLETLGQIYIKSIDGEGGFTLTEYENWHIKGKGFIGFIYYENLDGLSTGTENVDAVEMKGDSYSDPMNFVVGYTVETAMSIPLYSTQKCDTRIGEIPAGATISILEPPDWTPDSYGIYYVSNNGAEGWIKDMDTYTIKGYEAFG